MESILTSVKKMLGIADEYTHFDPDVIMNINSALMTLTQLGIGPEEGFSICDDTSTWIEFIGDSKKVEAVKTYVFIQVKLVFDPPASAAVISSYERKAQELEWRLNVAVDPAQREEAIQNG